MPKRKLVNGELVKLTAAEEVTRDVEELDWATEETDRRAVVTGVTVTLVSQAEALVSAAECDAYIITSPLCSMHLQYCGTSRPPTCRTACIGRATEAPDV